MNTPDEVFWIDQIKAGDNSSFAKLYGRYHRKLYAICYQFTRNQSDSEDQLQEIFLKILKSIDSYRMESSFSTWVTRLSINHLINFQNRQRHRYQQPFAENNDLEHSEPMVDVELSLTLGQSITELPDGFRQVFILHEQLGYRHDEIGKILDIGASTSRSQLSRARMILREKLRTSFDKAAP